MHKPESFAKSLSRELDEQHARDREQRAADQAAVLDAQDRAARERLIHTVGQAIGEQIGLDTTYAVFVVRDTAIAFSKPVPADRPKGLLLVGTRSPIWALEQRVQAAAGIGVVPPRLIVGRRRLPLDAADVDLRA